MPWWFAGVRAPSVLGTFLQTFRFEHVRQLVVVAAGPLAGLAKRGLTVTTGSSAAAG